MKITFVPEERKIWGATRRSEGSNSGSEDAVDGRSGGRRMRRRRASAESDLCPLRLPPRTGLSGHELVVLLLLMLAVDLHRLRIGLPPADLPSRRSSSPDLDTRVEMKRNELGTFIAMARPTASAISNCGGVNSALLHLA